MSHANLELLEGFAQAQTRIVRHAEVKGAPENDLLVMTSVRLALTLTYDFPTSTRYTTANTFRVPSWYEIQFRGTEHLRCRRFSALRQRDGITCRIELEGTLLRRMRRQVGGDSIVKFSYFFIVTNICDMFFFSTSICDRASSRARCYPNSYASLCKNTKNRDNARILCCAHTYGCKPSKVRQLVNVDQSSNDDVRSYSLDDRATQSATDANSLSCRRCPIASARHLDG